MPEPILQCYFWPDEWKCLVVCMMLNRTKRAQVEKVVWKFFEKYPTPDALLAAPDEEISEMVKPLGFYRRRALALKKMSQDFLEGKWKNPEDLRSVGVYAATCYRMMFRSEVGVLPPNDHALKDLWVWMRKEMKTFLGRVLPDTLR